MVSGKIGCCKIMVIYDRFAASSSYTECQRGARNGRGNDETCDKIANEANLPARMGCF